MVDRPATDPGGAAGYLLVSGRIADFAKMGAYSKALPPVYARYGGAYVAIGGPGRGIEWLDGPHRDRSLVLARFDTVDAAQRFWWSPEYRTAAELRIGAGTFNVVAVPGLPDATRSNAEARPAAAPGGVVLLVATIVRDAPAYEAWRDDFAAGLATHSGRLLASATVQECRLLEGDPAWDRLEIARLPVAEAADALVSTPYGRALRERAGLAFVARAATVDGAR